MSEDNFNIKIGNIYKHIDGPKYRVDEILPDATGYENTGKIGKSVKYEQLEAGQAYPVGTIWVRKVEDFLDTIEVGGEQKKIFELMK